MRRLRHLAGPAGRLVGGVAERPRSGRRCDGPRVRAPPRAVWDPDYEAGGRRDNGLGCGWSRSAATAGGAQDEVGNLLRVSDQRQVTGVHLDRLRMHTKTIEVNASHLSLITHPQEITDLILSAAGRSG